MGSSDAFGIIALITALIGIFDWLFYSIIYLTITYIVLNITAAVLPLIQDSPDLLEIFLNNFLLPATEWFPNFLYIFESFREFFNLGK